MGEDGQIGQLSRFQGPTEVVVEAKIRAAHRKHPEGFLAGESLTWA